MTVVETLEACIEGWAAALAADAANPKPDYSIDGQTISRAQYRATLMKLIQDAIKTIQLLEPFELRGRTI